MWITRLKRYSKKYLCYRLEKDFERQLDLPDVKACRLSPHIDMQSGGKLTIRRGYTWNGCSPKLDIFGMVIGTPEGVLDEVRGVSKTYYPSLVHDVLYQLNTAFPEYIQRKQADVIFLQLMKENTFLARWLYYFVVRLFGRSAWIGKK